MEFGCVFPTIEIGQDVSAIRDFIQAAEELGYQHLLAYDHVVGAVHADRSPELMGPYDETHPFHEPFALLAFAAGITKTINLETGVIIAPQRQSALIAKQAAQLAILSENRFRLGVGTGWNHVEYEALGMPFAGRGKMLDEQIALWRRLWSGEVVTFEGEFHTVDRASMLPVPSQPVPIWLGGGADVALRRAAAVGDGFLFGSAGRYGRKQLARIGDLLDENGRSRDDFAAHAQIGFGNGPAAWDEAMAGWTEAGGDCISVRTMSVGAQMVGDVAPDFTSPQQHIDALETFISHARGRTQAP